MSAVASVDLRDRGVVLVHCGERNLTIAAELRRRGARLTQICPYEWALPEDLGPITSVIRALIAQQLDAVLFTNQVQCRHLFEVAAEMSLATGLTLSLNQQVVVGAVGPVSARALGTVGVIPHVVPRTPNMSSLITAVAEYFDAHPDLEPGRATSVPASSLVG
jgi:uroporphyrinogen-III synthase